MSPGRLNVLANVMRKPMEQVGGSPAGCRPAGCFLPPPGNLELRPRTAHELPLASASSRAQPHWCSVFFPPSLRQVFSEFAGRKPVHTPSPDDPDTYMGSGDVKYHLGTSYDRPTISGALSCSGVCFASVEPAGWGGKYHLGTSYDRPTI